MLSENSSRLRPAFPPTSPVTPHTSSCEQPQAGCLWRRNQCALRRAQLTRLTKSVPCSLFPTLHPVGSRKFADSSSSLTPIVALAYASSRIWPSLSWFHRLPCVTGALSVYALSYRWSAMTVRLRRMDACVWTCWKCHPPVWSVVVAKTLANLVSYLRHTSDTTSTACGAPRDYLRRRLRSHISIASCTRK